MKTKIKILVFGLVVLLSSCSDDYFDVKTTANMTSEDAAKAMDADPTKLAGFVNAIYNVMVQYDLVSTSHDSFGFMSILHSTDMMSEDIVSAKLHWFQYDYLHDNHDETYRRTRVNWTYLYTVISSANNVLAMTSAETTSADVKAYRGQVLALRGMAYFYLIQLYQHLYPISESGTRPGIPMYYAGNEGKEDIPSRAPVSEVLSQIESDLTTAVADLQGWNRDTKNQIDYYVANGLLARYYLLTEQWEKAYDAAAIAESAYSIMPASELTDGFMDINGTEVMWGYDENAETTTLYASFFSHISNLTGGYAGLNYAPRLIDKRLYESIPSTDARKNLFQNPQGTIDASARAASSAIAWQLPYANLKFGWDGNFTMDYTYMRASEMVLIEAEALAHEGKNGDAATVLKRLMEKRDPSWNESSVTVDDVWEQRRIELWGEGFSFFDLKRLNKGIDRTYSGTNHYPSAQIKVDALDKTWIYQIPNTEIIDNPYIPEDENNE